MLILIGCSSPDERKNIAGEIGEVIWQKYPQDSDRKDSVLVISGDKDCPTLKLVLVSSYGTIYRVYSINGYCVKKENK